MHVYPAGKTSAAIDIGVALLSFPQPSNRLFLEVFQVYSLNFEGLSR